MASTESTGGSTTGDDEESSDAAVQSTAVDKVLLETRRNTYQNESIANSYRQVMIQFVGFFINFGRFWLIFIHYDTF